MISIIIPCYNDFQFVESAVDSALNQDYGNIEVIVVDDGSDAKTKTILKRLEPRITKLLTQENRGPSAARNAGITAATGKYILVHDSDDYFESSFCNRAIEVLQKNENVKAVTCYARWFQSDEKFRIFKPSGGDLKDFLIQNATLSNSMFRKSDWRQAGGYDEKMIHGFEDWEFFIRLHMNGGKTHVIPEILFHYRMREDSVSKKANSRKYDLLRYIYQKHENLYIQHHSLFIDHLLQRIEQEELNKLKKEKAIEFKTGYLLLQPLRFVKKLLPLKF
ncbi:glycosyltransferase family 2 protein [Christiangramia sp. OXR-203]|uniref:glycosyltransferase family 2 protein n=1 Tax=Christiangramia sp. OXR-203 TaxID=3100176 RepID=UPI002AC924C1|nr:glycosyltransferase [Christiangramia sp. OXR-203]WPY97910.1 glycosyltransferase [Christiangramia sp. OXR-203]